jgi:Uma2 family endonuclease
MTVEAFLEWEERQELRYEFDGFQAVAMNGGTIAHNLICRNLAIAIGGRLRGKPCQFMGSTMKVKVDGRIRYPDGMVVCSQQSMRATVAEGPVVLFEVLSNSSAQIDCVVKNREYAVTSSVNRYIILSQVTLGGTMFERVGDAWVGSLLPSDLILRMPEIGIEVPVSEFYEGVHFETHSEEP